MTPSAADIIVCDRKIMLGKAIINGTRINPIPKKLYGSSQGPFGCSAGLAIPSLPAILPTDHYQCLVDHVANIARDFFYPARKQICI